MMLLRLVSWRYTQEHASRALLTCLGIVLGVGVFVGMHTANQSVRHAFTATVDQIAGSTQLQVSAGESGFPEEVLERVQSVKGVRAAGPVIESTVYSGIASQGNLLILGVDLTTDRNLRDYDFASGEEQVIDDPLVFLAQPDSILISNEFASRARLATGSRVRLETMQGPRSFVVRGIMRSGGLSKAFGGSLAIMDIYAAQLMFGRGRTFDRIDLTIDSGVSVGAVKSAIQRELGPTFTVDPPSQRGQQFESLTRVYGAMANLTSLFALFIGMFIIYNTFAIAVSQRRKEIGILRALGATRRQIRHLFLAESAVTGSLGSLGGIGLGLVIAKLMAAGLSQFLGELYGVVQRADEIATDPLLLTGSFILGVITSVIAGWLPAQAAAGVDPVHALQKGKSQSVTQGEYRWRLRAALLCGLGSVPCLIWSGDKALFYLGYFLNILASLLLTPTLSSWLASALRPVLKSIRPVEGSLAADSLIQSPRRTSGTVAALMLSLAMVVSIGGLARSSYQAIVEWMDLALSPDLFVSPTENFAQRNFRFPAEIAGAIANVPGIADVQRVRMLRIPYRNSQVLLFSAEISSLMRHATLPPVEGEPRVMYPEAASGKACLISENFMNLYGVHKGDRVQLPAPQGMLELPVAGVVKDYSDQQGSILIDRSLMLRHWNDPSINVIRVYLRPGSSAAGVREDMLNRFGSASRLVVLTNQDLRAYILKVTDQWFGITYVQIAVAVLVALLGIVNSLIVSITDRRRELGVMTAVGALRMQIRATIWLEAVTIGFIGLILGLFWGAINLRYALEMSRQDMGGFGLAYVYPLGIALALIPGILAVAFLAGAGPAESAVRSSLVEALEYE